MEFDNIGKFGLYLYCLWWLVTCDDYQTNFTCGTCLPQDMVRGCDDCLNKSDKIRCFQYIVIKWSQGKGTELTVRKVDV
jgi:hypothetical protein